MSDKSAERVALLAEARGWFGYAVVSGSVYRDWLHVGAAQSRYTGSLPPRVYADMRDRAESVIGESAPFRSLSYEECVLLQLFLALECEDQARELSAKRERKQNARRSHGERT